MQCLVHLQCNTIIALTLIKFYEVRKQIDNRIEIFLSSSFEQNPTVSSENLKKLILDPGFCLSMFKSIIYLFFFRVHIQTFGEYDVRE